MSFEKAEKGKQGNFGLCVNRNKFLEDCNMKGKIVKLSGEVVDSEHCDNTSPGLDIVKGMVEGTNVSVWLEQVMTTQVRQ